MTLCSPINTDMTALPLPSILPSPPPPPPPPPKKKPRG